MKRRETQSTNFKTTFTLESGTFYLDVSIFFCLVFWRKKIVFDDDDDDER